MKVRAKDFNAQWTGYFNNVRIRPGQEFEVSEEQFSEKWMERVDTEVVNEKEVKVEKKSRKSVQDKKKEGRIVDIEVDDPVSSEDVI